MKFNVTSLCKRRQSRIWRVRSICFVLLSILVTMQAGFAGDIGRLYEASVKADAKKNENDLILEAYTNVLIKVSGRSDVLASPAYDDLLQKAQAAISQFRYDNKIMPATESLESNVPENSATKQQADKEKWFWVSFNPQSINASLTAANIPIWGKVRPETLIWFSQEVKGKRFLKSQYDAPDMYQILKNQADTRGISLIFPFLDLQDQSSISATDIWGNFSDAILLASKRYHAQSTLTIKLFQEPSGLWVSQWNLLLLGETQSWEIRDKQADRVLASGVDELADKLARQFTQHDQQGDKAGVLVQINNVNSFKEFQLLDDYLRNLATVKALTLKQMEHDRLIYNIDFLGSQNSLIQEIRLGDVLNSVERSTMDTDSTDNANHRYQAVILDDLDKSKETVQKSSSREQALKSLDKTETSKKAGNETTPEETMPVLKKTLQADLEYWFAR